MTLREFIKWNLEYTMPRVIGNFEAIPDDLVCVRPRPNVNSPGWILGHVAVTERLHVGRFVEGVDDVPKRFRVFRAAKPSGEDVRRVVESKEALVSYWHGVRAKTEAYLDRITDEDLLKVPQHDLRPPDVNQENVTAEWFVMTIQHQNQHNGELHLIRKLIESSGGD
jgi:uncharacterized damage-inducible protein DinB